MIDEKRCAVRVHLFLLYGVEEKEGTLINFCDEEGGVWYNGVIGQSVLVVCNIA